jgi:hypothetical protein
LQYEISDRAAVEFTRGFYSAIADGLPVDAAVAEARSAVSYAIEGTLEWGTPVLYMRSPDGRIFDLAPRPQPVVGSAALIAARPAPVETTLPATPTALPVAPPPRKHGSRWRVLAAALAVIVVAVVFVLSQPAGRPSQSAVAAPTAAAVEIAGATAARAGQLTVAQTLAPAPAPTRATVSRAQPPANWAVLQSQPFQTFVNPKLTSSSWQGSRAVDSNKALVWTVSSATGVSVSLPVSESSTSDTHTILTAAQTSGPAARYGLVMHYKDSSNYYRAMLNDSRDAVTLQLYLDNTWSTLIADKKYTRVPNTPNILAVRNEGTHYTVYVNDQLMGEVDDSRLAGGRAGIALDLSVSSEERVISFSAFVVYVPPTP